MTSYRERIGEKQQRIDEGWSYIQSTISNFNQDDIVTDDARNELLNYINELNMNLYNDAKNLTDLTLKFRFGIPFNQPNVVPHNHNNQKNNSCNTSTISRSYVKE